MKNINKKGYSFSGWVEGVLLVILFMGILTGVISNMNIHYGTAYEVGIGDTITSTQGNLTRQVTTGSDAILEGEPEVSTEGLTLKSSWGILRGVSSTLWSFP